MLEEETKVFLHAVIQFFEETLEPELSADFQYDEVLLAVCPTFYYRFCLSLTAP